MPQPPPGASDAVARRTVVQGAYYVVTGAWPLVSMRSFEWVTGPKVDRWLVKTVGLLSAVIGLTLLRQPRRADLPTPDRTLGVGSALAFAAVDLVYVARGRIRPIYLADAAVQLGLAFGRVSRTPNGIRRR